MKSLAIVLVMALAVACSGESSLDGTVSTTAAEPSSTATSMAPTTSTATTVEPTTTTAEPTASTDGWTRVPHDEAIFGGDGDRWMRSVVAGGPGLVAVGFDASAGDEDAAVWTSPDGITWSRVPRNETVFGGINDQRMNSVVAGGPGLVAVGFDVSGGDADGVVWTSPDGITWTRVPTADADYAGPDFQVMYSVVAGGPGLVATGIDGPLEDGDGAVWTSPDGLTWSKVPHDEAVFGGREHQVMNHVALGGPGLVAVGTDRPGDEGSAAVWTSPDGLTWTRVPHDEEVFGGPDYQAITSVAVGGPGLVAVGYDLADFAALEWTSPDGVTWTRVPRGDPAFRGPDYPELWSVVVAVGPGLVAVGYDLSGGDGDAAVWTSLDGFAWTRATRDEEVFGGPEDQEIVWVAEGGPGLVAVGYEGSSGDWDAAVWYWTPDRLE